MPWRAMSIMPLDVVAPTKMPTAATMIAVLNFATLAPTAGLIKFTASLATPIERSNVASVNRVPSPLHLSPFSPPDGDRRVDPPELSGRVLGLPGTPQDEAGLTRKFETSPVGGPTCQKTPISLSALEKNPRPGHLFEGNPVGEGTTRRGTVTVVHRPETPAVPHTAEQGA